VIAQIAGIGCVTPLGSDPGEIRRRIGNGERAAIVEMKNPHTGRTFPAAPVPQEHVAHLNREPRLRRASAISLLAAAAGKAAIADGALDLTPAVRSRLALVFGVSSGGVQYTRRFYEQVVKEGANAASPLLFPETVYNAPASHLASILGMDGSTYTLVGDGTVGLQALHFGAQLLETGEADHVLVVAAEELDWILLEAHRDWRLTAADGRAIPHGRSHTGALLAEGAAAVLLGREGRRATAHLCEGRTCFSRREAAHVMDGLLAGFAGFGPVDLIVSGGNGTWADDAIASAVKRHFPKMERPWLTPKDHLGEALGAGALLQVVMAVDVLGHPGTDRALVVAMGWNQQAAAALVEKARICRDGAHPPVAGRVRGQFSEGSSGASATILNHGPKVPASSRQISGARSISSRSS
jgi:3-oxoacyl-(acyl-carrier-protein) synthase